MIGETDFRKASRAVHAAGYASDPEYADKLIRLIEQHGLTDWDALDEITHTVVRGDTLWSLAVRYLGSGHRWIEIQQANGGIDPHRLQIGTTLRIPGGASK